MNPLPHDILPAWPADVVAPRAAAHSAHLVGIAGAGMRSLADVLHAAGWQVSGSDLLADSLADRRFDVRLGHHAEAIDANLDLVVYSTAVPETNPEICRARELGLCVDSYPQALGRVMAARSGVAIAGTHGKSTTTAMAASILTAGGFDPTVVCGAAEPGKFSGGRLGHSRWLVAEACEYREAFCHMRPQIAVVLGIEPDHFDCFATPAALEAAFAQFLAGVPREGLVLLRAECAATARAAAAIGCMSESFGLVGSPTWLATDLAERRGYYTFNIRRRGRLVCGVKLQVPGKHNVANALAAAAVASHCGAAGPTIRAGLERFSGLARRLEWLGEPGGVALVDDYAHHPTEVTASLAAVRQMYPDRRLWCVFQPHQVSRTRHLLDAFSRSLDNADRVIVADIFGAREAAATGDRHLAAELAARTRALGGNVEQLASTAEIHDHLSQALRPGDVLVTMGAGDIGRVAHELDQGFRTFRQAG